MTKPSALNGRLTKWAMLLSQYDMHFLPQKATKGQAIADLLAENPRSDSVTLFEELPDETAEVHSAQANPSVWQMYFDGASQTIPPRRTGGWGRNRPYFAPKPCHSACDLSYRTSHQQCCRVQRPAHWLAISTPAWSEEPP